MEDAVDKVLGLLRAAPVFRDLHLADMELIRKHSVVHRYEAGEKIISEGSFDDRLYVLLSGFVTVKKDGAELNAIDERFDIFGEMGIIDGGPRSADVIAGGHVTCLVMEMSMIESRKELSALFHKLAARALARRMRESDMALARAGRKPSTFFVDNLREI